MSRGKGGKKGIEKNKKQGNEKGNVQSNGQIGPTQTAQRNYSSVRDCVATHTEGDCWGSYLAGRQRFPCTGKCAHAYEFSLEPEKHPPGLNWGF